MTDGASIVPAGWYPDPADDSRLRRWDGAQWTQDVIISPSQPLAPAPMPSQPASVPRSFAPPPPAQPAQQQGFATGDPRAQPAAQPTAEKRSDPPSGPISMPEWANLPGITLPPDLSDIPGFEEDTVLHAPAFEEPERVLPPSNWNQQPVFIPTAPQAEEPQQPRVIRLADSVLPPPQFTPAPQPAASTPPPMPPGPPPPPAPPLPPQDVPSAQSFPPPAAPRRGPTPAQHYAPPPSGSQYDVPPPPGAAHVTGSGIALPASSLLAPHLQSAAWASGPVIDRDAAPLIDFDALPRTSADPRDIESLGTLTTWVWLIAALPLIQFLGVYLVFMQLHVSFSPGSQWGILAAPAAISLLLASGDRRKLNLLGVDRVPSPLLAIVPPVYLLVRAFDVGRSSAGPLVAWIVVQVAAGAGVYLLMPHILAQATAGL